MIFYPRNFARSIFMKRLAIIILISFSLFQLTANNLQQIYTTRDTVYKRVEALCSQAGVIGPSSFSPLPARALIIALDRIDTNRLSATEAAEYKELYSILTEQEYLIKEDYFSMDLNAGVNLGINIADYSDFNYGNTNSDIPLPDHREDTLIPYRYEDALISAGLNMNFGDYIYLEAAIDLKNKNQQMFESTLGWIYSPFIPEQKKFLAGPATEWPYRAGASIGNNYFNFILGRFPHSIGNGITGNLLVGDNFNYQEISNISLMSNFFTYNISITRFDQQETYADNPNYTKFSKNEFDGMQQFRVLHRFDFNIVDKARFAINLATIYNSHYGFDLRFFYPFVLSHNYYNYTNSLNKQPYDEANNIMSFELEWNITKGLKATAQIAIDQFQMFWEDKTSIPAAYGILTNLKYTANLGDGNLTSWFEFVYTNPYLYLNVKRDSNDNNIDYNLDYIVGYRMHYMDDVGFSGYVYGPDSIVFSIGASYIDSDDKFEIGGNILYRIHGSKGLKINASNDANTIIDMSDAIIEQNPGEYMNNTVTPSGGWKTAEHLLKFAVYGTYNFNFNNWGILSTYSAVGFNTYFNYNHTSKIEFQPQLLIGAKWKY